MLQVQEGRPHSENVQTATRQVPQTYHERWAVNKMDSVRTEERELDMGRLNLEEKEISQDRLNLYNISGLRSPPVMIEMVINKNKVRLEVDTGASCTVMSLKKFKELGRLQDLEGSQVKLTTYTGEVITPKGAADVKVEHEGEVKSLPLLVTDGEVPTLLGRNWMKELKLNWERLFALKEEETSVKMSNM